jgi:crotonobetainyl-CoA:carnitine CoA-transferase CaiB-like acyl-CoA transferase
MTTALDGVTVVELTTEFWSAVGSAVLADFGATVIRIESPGATATASEGGWDPETELAQRNKRSVVVDTDDDAGREIIRELVSGALVFVTDWPRERLQACGLDYEGLCKHRPDIIYARGSGFGPLGPDRDLPAVDELAAARTGMMPILQQPGQPPVYAGVGQMYTAVMLALGISIALHHLRETGEGQEVDVSLLGGNMYGASLDVQAFLAMGGERFLQPVSRLDAGNPMSGVMYPSKDDRWVCLTMPDTDRWWPGLAKIVSLDVDDPRFDTHDKRCGENRLLMMEVLEGKFRERDADHWKRSLTENNLSADVIEDFDFPASDPQVLNNRYIVELDRPGVGKVKSLGFPIFMSDTPARLDRMAPCVGQHTEQVLHDLLGYSEDQIRELKASGTIS